MAPLQNHRVREGLSAFQASVMGCDAALSGFIYLSPDRKVIYMAEGVAIVGRGNGRWVVNSDGGAAAMEIEILQYAAAACSESTIPQKPHRFRGVWLLEDARGPMRGDWYFITDDGETGRLVGTFDAAATMAELPVDAQANGRTPDAALVPDAVRAVVMADLDKQVALSRGPIAPIGSQLDQFKVGSIANVHYIPNWIEAVQEKEFMRLVDGDKSPWDSMTTRRTQEWGSGDRCPCGRGLMKFPLPPYQEKLAQALHNLGIFDGVLFPMNSVRINSYTPGQGIFPHCDGPVYFPKIAVLNLNGSCLLSFYPRTGNEDCMKWDSTNEVPGGYDKPDKPLFSLLLEPRSLLLFEADAFWHNRHGISTVVSDVMTQDVANLHLTSHRLGEVVERGRRVSLTMRHLMRRCNCQG